MNKILPKRFYKKVAPAIAVPVKTLQFPNISLSFPEITVLTGNTTLVWKIVLFNFTCGFLLTGIVLVGNEIRANKTRLVEARAAEQTAAAELAYWKGVVKTHAGYRDAFYQVARLEYQLGNRQAALSAVSEALVLDPLSEKVQRLAEEIRG